MSSKKENTPKKDEALLDTARRRFDLAVNAEAEIRANALDDLKFRTGEQWPEDVKNARGLDNRPCLTINRIPQFVRQVTNDQRQNRPAIRVSPVDDNADVDTAKVLAGLIRHIEYNSNADVAYDTAFESAVVKGFGFFRVVTDYVSPTSFDQEILIKRIKNAFSVYVDPYYSEPDGSDMNWAFIFEDISKEDYEKKYPNSELASMEDWKSLGDKQSDWLSGDSCRVAEYFYKTFTEKEIVLLESGDILFAEDLKDSGVDEAQIEDRRKTQIPVIKWCKVNAIEVLEETVWPGQWIPVIPVLGDEIDVDGRRILEGIVRHAKDPQRMYNYWASSETETIALAPRAPFIGVEGQFEGHEAQWRTANQKNHAYLEYKPKSIGGQPVGAPQRNVYEPPVQAITNARMQSSEDLKATTGIYDAALGARSNEQSGIAIQRRNIQAQTSNFHYVDNLSRALRHLGRILCDLIPKVYDTERTARIIGEDGQEEMVTINGMFEEYGEQKIHNLSIGKYDVAVDTGPSYATKRQEALDAMLDLSAKYPQLTQMAGDLIVGNMDFPGAKDVSDRLKKTLPPGIADDGEQKQMPPEAKQQLDQMSAMVEQLSQQLEAANDTLQNKKLELDNKLQVEALKAETALRRDLMKYEAEQGFEAAKLQLIDEIKQLDQFQQMSQSDFNGAGPMGAETLQDQPLTDEQPMSGNYMGDDHEY